MSVIAVFVILMTVGAIIGYTTKWVSVQLIFKPSSFVGVGPLGWQGVVQRRSPKFAAGVADMLGDIAPVSEIISRVDSNELAAVSADALAPVLTELAPTVLDELRAGLWDESTPEVRQMLVAMIAVEAQGAIAEMIDKALPELGEAIDVRPMIVEMLSGENADRLALLVQTIASKELRTVIRYGAVVGLFVGFVEALMYVTLERWWLLPVIGAIDGVVNNYMGIQMIFRPHEPRRYFGLIRYQGLFPKRQAEIAHDYGYMMASEVLTPRAILDEVSRLHP